MNILSFLMALFLFSCPLFADDFEHAPPAFSYNDGRVVPVDIAHIDLELTFDCSSHQTIGKAMVEFYANEKGFPIIDMVPEPLSIKLNGLEISVEDYPIIKDPNQVTKIRVILKEVKPKVKNLAEISYRLSNSNITYESNTVRAGLFMTDLSSRGYWEQYGPSNLLFDQFSQTIRAKVIGSNKEHEIFVNGNVISTYFNEWLIDFSAFYNSSSFYFHLNPSGRFQKKQITYTGTGKSFPITVYSETSSQVENAIQAIPKILREMETNFGPYPHNRLLAYVTETGGGMEYSGATMTAYWALNHEVAHSWFARGVLAADGNAGWIDEAVVTWRDNDYDTAFGPPDRDPVNMANFSLYKRETSYEAYTEGADLISEFEFMFKDQGGMKPILHRLFADFKYKVISTNDFEHLIETLTGQDLAPIFKRYVYGIGENSVTETDTDNDDFASSIRIQKHLKRTHPRPYTSEELALYH